MEDCLTPTVPTTHSCINSGVCTSAFLKCGIQLLLTPKIYIHTSSSPYSKQPLQLKLTIHDGFLFPVMDGDDDISRKLHGPSSGLEKWDRGICIHPVVYHLWDYISLSAGVYMTLYIISLSVLDF